MKTLAPNHTVGSEPSLAEGIRHTRHTPPPPKALQPELLNAPHSLFSPSPLVLEIVLVKPTAHQKTAFPSHPCSRKGAM